MYPSIGRIVHYITPDGRHVPAIVTQARPASMIVKLCVFDRDLDPGTGLTFLENVGMASDPPVPGTWHWSEGTNG